LLCCFLTNQFTSTGTDFIRSGVREGDLVNIDYTPKTGTVSLADPVLTLATKDLQFSLDNGSIVTVVFVNDVGTPGAVSRDGVAEQINSYAGEEICSIVEVSSGDFRLVMNPTRLLNIEAQPSSAFSANTLLGFSNVVDTNNYSSMRGSYVITFVDTNYVLVDATFGTSTTANQFTVTRLGEQRIVATQMSNNTAEAGLYYWDVELLSEGAGNIWNIGANEDMTVTGYRSDGYYVTTRDSNQSFSSFERMDLHISRSFLEVGTDDSPANATQVSGQSLLLTYELSELVGNYDDTLRSDTERVINASPLARHLMPHLVRFSLTYTGGPSTGEVEEALSRFIRDLLSDQPMYVHDLQREVVSLGVNLITNPITLYAVVHDYSRNIRMHRSQNEINVSRLAAFIPDRLDLVRVFS